MSDRVALRCVSKLSWRRLQAGRTCISTSRAKTRGSGTGQERAAAAGTPAKIRSAFAEFKAMQQSRSRTPDHHALLARITLGKDGRPSSHALTQNWEDHSLGRTGKGRSTWRLEAKAEALAPSHTSRGKATPGAAIWKTRSRWASQRFVSESNLCIITIAQSVALTAGNRRWSSG